MGEDESVDVGAVVVAASKLSGVKCERMRDKLLRNQKQHLDIWDNN